jgi:broad specificity phosphatase PhoE
MKWPNNLIVIRHGESEYNARKIEQERDPTYQEFIAAYNDFEKDPDRNRDAAFELAMELHRSGRYRFSKGDRHTPITELGQQQAETTGRKLAEILSLPDIIMVSPYLRTKQTLGAMAVSWPELAEVRVIEEERLREQEHGLRAVYGDWRIFNVIFPDQMESRSKEGPYWFRHMQGESVPDVRERIRSLTGTVIRDFNEKNVWWVTHHLTKLSMRANFERFGEEEFVRLDQEEKPVNCGVTDYEGDPSQGKDGRLVLKAYNQKLY